MQNLIEGSFVGKIFIHSESNWSSVEGILCTFSLLIFHECLNIHVMVFLSFANICRKFYFIILHLADIHVKILRSCRTKSFFNVFTLGKYSCLDICKSSIQQFCLAF